MAPFIILFIEMELETLRRGLSKIF